MAEQAVITKRASTLPPDYLSWTQLRERWLLKQQQKKELEAKQNAILENQETGFTDGNQVETQIENTDGNKVENLIENKKKRNTNKSRKNRKKKQPFVDGKLENHQNEEFVSKIGKGNETIVPKKPIGEISGVVSQKNGNNGAGNSAKVSRAKFGDETKGNNGYNKRGNRKRVGGNRFGNNEVENHVESSKGSKKSKSLNEMGKSEVLAVGDETKGNNGYNKKGNRKRVGANRFGNNEVENHVESSKGSKKSKSLNEMGKSAVLAVCEKLDGLKVKESDGFQRKDDSVVGLGLSDEKLVENVKTGNAVGNYRNKKGNAGRKFGCRDRRLGNNRTVGGNVSEKSEAETQDKSSKGGEKGKDSEDMSKNEVLEVGVKVDGDGFQRKDDSVVGVELNDAKLVENGAKDDESVKTRNAVGKYGNRSGNVGRKFGCRPGFGDRRLGNNRTVGGNVSEKSEAEMHDESSKGGEKGKDLEEMSKSEVLAVGEKLDGLKVKDSAGFQRKEDSLVGLGLNYEKLVENGEKDDENVKTRNAVGKYGNMSGNVGRKCGRRPGFGDQRLGNNRTVGGNVSEKSEAEMHDESSKVGEKGKDLEEMSKSKVLAVGEKLDGDGFQRKDDSVVGVELNDKKSVDNRLKDDEKVEAKNGLGRNGNGNGNGNGNVGRKFGGPAFGNRRRVGGNKSERSEAEMLVKSSKGHAKGKDSEEMSKSEVLDVGVKLDCLKLIDGNGSQGKDDSLVGVGLNDDQIVGNENRAKDDEKGKAGNEFGKYRNGSGNVGRKFQRRNYAGNAVGNRNYGGSGRLGGGRRKQSGNVKVWVKKEDKSGANASQVGFTGI